MKKWSYAAAMMLAISSGCIFTGCIDNDEPYGIEQIRVATASLLEAKKNAVAAEAAAANAELEIAKINAEIEKLKAENEKIVKESEAKINEAEAEARLLRAKADAAMTEALAAQYNAQAAQWQAQADDQKAKTEAYIKEQEAILNERIALAELNVKDAQLKYDRAVYDFEEHKAYQAEGANDALWQQVESWFNYYLGTLNDYNWANKDYLEATRRLAELETDLKWEPAADGNGGQFVSPAYDQKATLVNEKASLERQQAAAQKQIDLYDEFVAALENVKGTEMYSLLEKYQADYETAELDYQKAYAALQPVTTDPANKEIFDKPAAIQNDINALKEEEIDIPGWTYEPIPQLHVLGNGWDKAHEVVAEGKYSLNNPTNYDNAKRAYESAIQEIKAASFDDNDQVWSDASIKELKRNIPLRAEQVTRSWNKAKAVYNNGEKVTADAAKKAPNGEAVQKTADAFNASMAPLAAARDALYAAEEANQKAAAQYSPFGTTQAQNNYYAWQTAQSDWQTAQNDWQTAQNDWKAVDIAGADKESQDYKNAETAYKNAETAYKNAETAYKEAEKKYKPLADAFEAAEDDLYGKKDKDGVRQGGKNAAYRDAVQKSDDALTAFNDAVQEQLNEINKYQPTNPNTGGLRTYSFAVNPNTNLSSDLNAYANDRSEDKSVEAPVAKIPFVQEVNGIYVNAKNYVIFASQYTFGDLTTYDNIGTVDWDKDLAILLPIDFANPIDNTTQILNLFNGYLEKMFPGVGPWEYSQKYDSYFGAYADVLKKLYNLQIGEAYLNNDLNAALQEVLETPEKNLEDMIATYDEQNQKLQDLEKQAREAQDACRALLADASANEQEAKSYKNALKSIVDSLQGVINQMETAATDPYKVTVDGVVMSAVSDLKGYYEEKAEDAKDNLATLAEQIARIEYQIEKYGDSENGYASLENPYSYQVEYLKTVVENAKELMEFAKARYEALQAKYDAANK